MRSDRFSLDSTIIEGLRNRRGISTAGIVSRKFSFPADYFAARSDAGGRTPNFGRGERSESRGGGGKRENRALFLRTAAGSIARSNGLADGGTLFAPLFIFFPS